MLRASEYKSARISESTITSAKENPNNLNPNPFLSVPCMFTLNQNKSMEFSTMDALERPLSRTEILNHAGRIDEEIRRVKFASITNIPEVLKFSININQLWSGDGEDGSVDVVNIKFWLDFNGLSLHEPLQKILLKRHKESQSLSVWQAAECDGLLAFPMSICRLIDSKIQLKLEIELISNVANKKNIKIQGSTSVFDSFGFLKSGLIGIPLGEVSPSSTSTPSNLLELEERFYSRKRDEAPNWHVELMKKRLLKMRKEFFESNPGCWLVYVILPQPNHPIRLLPDPWDDFDVNELCERDLQAAQDESRLKRRHLELFPTASISSNEMRLIRSFLGSCQYLENPANIPTEIGHLLWTHRDFLAENMPTALAPFILSIQWWLEASDRAEIDEALECIGRWKIPEDASLKEEMAVIILNSLRHCTGLVDSPIWKDLFATELLKNMKDLFPRQHSSTILAFMRDQSGRLRALEGFLKELLFNSVLSSIDETSKLYWRLKATPQMVKIGMLEEFQIRFSESLRQEIGRQERLFQAVEDVISGLVVGGRRRLDRMEILQKALTDPEQDFLAALQQMPMIPGLQRTPEARAFNAVPDRSHLFKSTALTVLIHFLARDDENSEKITSLPLIFKRGDDLRKDAAALRIFRLIWRIWQEDAGLELFPSDLLYGVLPIGCGGGGGSNEHWGIVEFVPSLPLSRIQRSSEADVDEGGGNTEEILNYLQKQCVNPEVSGENFMKSCVGWALLTFILGVGDRHLDNLLLTPEGHLLHIDFAYLFGDDPKPFPPPIKMTREMVRGLGGQWLEFKGLCFTALGVLRRRAAFILAAISAELAVWRSERTATVCESAGADPFMSFVRERLLGAGGGAEDGGNGGSSSPAEQLQKFDQLLEESRSALLPQVMETIHKWAQYWKN